MKTPFLIGRIIFGGFFVYNGINHLKQRQSLSQYAAAKKIPMPEAAVTISGIALLLGGGSILLGIKPKMGAAAIMSFLAGVSPTMHAFWRAEDPKQRMDDMINFGKNMALLGGPLALMGVEEPWPVSLPVSQPARLERVRRFARRPVAA